MYRTLALALCTFAFTARSGLLRVQSHPKLVVVVVVDQMRADYLDRFAPCETGGLHFLASEGADFVNANYQHSPPRRAGTRSAAFWEESGSHRHCRQRMVRSWLQTSYPGARVYSISLKDRAAILLGGHHPQGAFGYSQTKPVNFLPAPTMLNSSRSGLDFNEARPADSYAGKPWTPLQDCGLGVIPHARSGRAVPAPDGSRGRT